MADDTAGDGTVGTWQRFEHVTSDCDNLPPMWSMPSWWRQQWSDRCGGVCVAFPCDRFIR